MTAAAFYCLQTQSRLIELPDFDNFSTIARGIMQVALFEQKQGADLGIVQACRYKRG